MNLKVTGIIILFSDSEEIWQHKKVIDDLTASFYHILTSRRDSVIIQLCFHYPVGALLYCSFNHFPAHSDQIFHIAQDTHEVYCQDAVCHALTLMDLPDERLT